MTQVPEITNLPRGARFFRADLHIHSAGGSHDVKDVQATPEAIVATAAKEGLKIIAIADHNEVSAVAPALAAAAAADVFVVPAVELSTPEGHLLCYLPNHDSLQRFHAQLVLVDRMTPQSRCQNGMLDCLNKLYASGGFAILAHVDAPGGLETEIPGSSPHKVDILCHRALLGIELKTAGSTVYYSNHDPDPIFIGIGQSMECTSTAVDCNGYPVPPDSWASSNTAVMTVNGFGNVTGVAVGKANIQANWANAVEGDPSACASGAALCTTAAASAVDQGTTTPTISVSCTPTDLGLGPTAPTNTTNGSCSTTQVNPSGGTFSWSVNKSTLILSSTSGASIQYSAFDPSSSQGDTTISVTYTVMDANNNNESATAQSQPITVHNPTSLMVLSDTTDPTGESCTGIPCLASPGSGNCNATTQNCSYSSYLRTRTYSTLDQFGSRFVSVGISQVDVEESLATTSSTCPNVTFVGGSSLSPDFVDRFWLCHTCCLPGGPGCSVSRSQTITVNGVTVRQVTINLGCSNVTLNP